VLNHIIIIIGLLYVTHELVSKNKSYRGHRASGAL
jgi:hypothetical protein